MCMVDDADPWDVVGTRNPVARKEHRCGECRRTIMPGETYEVTEGITDGHAARYKVCRHCQVLGAWLVELCAGYIFERVIEDVQEHLRDGIGGPDVARAYAWARIRWGQPFTVWKPAPIVDGRRVGFATAVGERGAGLVDVPVRLLVPEGVRA